MLWVDYIIIVVAILLSVVVLLQSSQDNIQDAFSGEKSELFKNKKSRGFELVMMRASAILGALLIILVVVSNNLH
ncbi:MAG: preprotein translocase subunit SecG [Candidatus Moranbacteria bacterium]|nr:preprotein translocase subunit SecG [Candidatus Moranbacteria bacterium]